MLNKNIVLLKSLNWQVVAISVFLTALWIANDFSERFIRKSTSIEIGLGETIWTEVQSKSITQRQKQYILSLYQQYNEQTNSELAPQEKLVLSKEQQALQKGLQRQMFVDDSKLELKAVITTKQNKNIESKGVNYALLLVTNVITGESEIKQYSHNSFVFDYKLSIVENTQVILTRLTHVHSQEDKSKEVVPNTQTIILTMYQTDADKE